MKFPSKVTPYKDSIFPKITKIIDKIKQQPATVLSLYTSLKRTMPLEEFIDALDCLFILNKIFLEGDVIKYANWNTIWCF